MWAYRRICLVLGFGLAASACGGGNGEAPDRGTATEVAELVLELSIGDDLGAAEEYQFSLIRSILIASDRTIWVADMTQGALLRGSPLLRQYDAEGTFVQQVAREGEGPGEYRQPEGLVELSDGRVAVRDLAGRGKVVLFTADGQFSETWSSSLGAGRLTWPSGGRDPLRVDVGGILWLPFSDIRVDATLQSLRIQPDGTVLDTVPWPTLPEVQPPVRMEKIMPGGGRAIGGLSSPYWPRAISAWSPMGTFAVGQTDQYRIEVLPPPPYGAATRVVECEIPVLPVPRAEREAQRSRMEQQIAEFNPDSPVRLPDIPEYKPPIRYMLFADDGQLLVWVHMPSRLQDGEWMETQAFDVFDPEGALRGRVVFPDSFRPYGPNSFRFYGMRGDMIWGVFTDELEVQSVRIYTVSWS